MRGRGSALMVLVCCLGLLHPQQRAGRASGFASAFHLPGTTALRRAAGATASPKAAPGAASAFSSPSGLRRGGGGGGYPFEDLPAAAAGRARQGGLSLLPNRAVGGSSTALSGSKLANAIFRSGSSGRASYSGQGAAGIQRSLIEVAQPLLSCVGVLLKTVSPSPLEVQFFVRLLVAASVGMFIGTERRTSHRPAGVRTMSLVALGACTFTLVSQFGFVGRADQARVAASVASGVGFIGAGVITTSGKEASMRDSLSLRGRGGNNFPGTTTSMNDVDGEVKGLTTASAIWITAGLGMACGAGLFFVATLGAGLTVGILKISEVITSLQKQLIRVRSILRPKLAQKLEEEAKAAEAKENEGKSGATAERDGLEAEEDEEEEKEKEAERKRKEEEEEKRKEEEEEKRLKMAEKERKEALAERMLENVEHAWDPFYGRPWGTEVPKVPLAGGGENDEEAAEPPPVSGPTRRTLSRSRVLASRKKRRDENRTRGLHLPIGSSPDPSLETTLSAASVSATGGRRRVEDPVLARSAITVGDVVISEKRMAQRQKRQDKQEQQQKQSRQQRPAKPEKMEQQKPKQQPSKKPRKPKKSKKQQQAGAKSLSVKDNDTGGATGPPPTAAGVPPKSPRSGNRGRRQSGGGDDGKGASSKSQGGERGERGEITTARATAVAAESENGGGRGGRGDGEDVQKKQKIKETAAELNGEDGKPGRGGGTPAGASGGSRVRRDESAGEAAVTGAGFPEKNAQGSPGGPAAPTAVVVVAAPAATASDAPGSGGRKSEERREVAGSRGATTSRDEGSAVGRAEDAAATPAGGGVAAGGEGEPPVPVSENQEAAEARARLADEFAKGKGLDGSRDSGFDL
ncbi:unnamed protein product [Scytosiphon promiscuus]